MSAAGFTDFNQDIRFNDGTNDFKQTCLDKWIMRVRFEADPTPTATSEGIGMGMRSVHYNEQKGNIVRLNMTNTVNQGKFSFYPEGESFTGQLQNVGTGYAFTPNDTYFFEVELDGFAWTARLLDENENELDSYTYTYAMTLAAARELPNTSKFGIYSFGGTRLLKDVQLYTSVYKKLDIAFIGDSNMRGHYAELVANRWADKFVADNYPNMRYSVFAGFADTVTNEVSTRCDEILAFNPTYAVISLMSNDINKGILQATYRAAYDALITALENAGVTVILTTIVPSNSWDVSIENAFINGKANTVIDLYTALKGAGTGLNGTYSSGDGVHLNIAGNAAAATQAATDWVI